MTTTGHDQGAVATLAGLPEPLWPELLRAFRRAAERLAPGDVPAALRPFMHWVPERLGANRPRRALAAALASDARLRDAVAEQVATGTERDEAATMPVSRIVELHGPATTAALLTVQGRWEELAALAADAADRVARRRRAARADDADSGGGDADSERARLTEALEAARRERDALRQRAAQAETRAAAAVEAREALEREVAQLRAERTRLRRTLEDERARADGRLQRARRRLAEAEQRARVDTDRARAAVQGLESLVGELRSALGEGDGPDGSARPRSDAEARPQAAHRDAPGSPPPLPRGVPPADPGRPCRLPPGLASDRADGVRALLACPGLVLVIDGYNVTKHPRGLGHGRLEEQRHWLAGVAAQVAARFGRRVVVAFDGADAPGAQPPAARGVQVVFSRPHETADDLVVGLVAGLGSGPALVVTDDRELRARVGAYAVDTTGVAAFLEAAGA